MTPRVFPAPLRAESRGTNAGNICGTAWHALSAAAGAGNAPRTGNEGCNREGGDRRPTHVPNEILTTRAAQEFLRINLRETRRAATSSDLRSSAPRKKEEGRGERYVSRYDEESRISRSRFYTAT